MNTLKLPCESDRYTYPTDLLGKTFKSPSGLTGKLMRVNSPENLEQYKYYLYLSDGTQLFNSNDVWEEVNG